jgi:hypothetical protein
MYKKRCAAAIATIIFAMMSISTYSASAQTAETKDNLLICNTPKQVERYIQLGMNEGDVAKVNSENNPTACATLTGVFEIVKVISSAPFEDANGRLWEVSIILLEAAATPHGVRPMNPPKAYYTVLLSKEMHA